MEFVAEYPLLVSASAGGIIAVHAMRGGPSRLKAHCIGRFLNVNFDGDRFVNVPITSMTIELRKNVRYDPKEKKLGELAQTM